jgi:hypothetical protein
MIIKSVILALGICFVNFAAAYTIAMIAMKKEYAKFFKILIGSMVIRYVLVSAVILLTLLFVELNKLYFGLTFLISTFILLLAEILYINYRSNLLILQNKMSKQG